MTAWICLSNSTSQLCKHSLLKWICLMLIFLIRQTFLVPLQQEDGHPSSQSCHLEWPHDLGHFCEEFPASLSSPCHSHRHASDRGGCIILHPVMLCRAEPQASGSSDMWEHWKVSCIVLGAQGSGVMYHNISGLFWRARGCQSRGLFVSSCLSYKPTLPFIMLDAELWRVWHFHSPTSNGSLFRFC